MKTRIIVTLTASLLMIGCSQESSKTTDLEALNLKGKVKCVKETSYRVEKNGDGNFLFIARENRKACKKDMQTLFDDRGNGIEIIFFNSDESISSKSEIEHNTQNNALGESRYDSEGKLLFKKKYKYNSKGKRIEEINLDADGKTQFISISTTDKNGDEVESLMFSENGSVDIKWISKFDKKGKRIEMRRLDEEADYEVLFSFKYDNEGKLIEEIEHRADGKIITKTSFKYDQSGQVVEEIFTDEDNNSELWVFEYEYDEVGNWIKRIEIKENKPVYLVVRDIDYF
jgi:YD repeat-containing protein